MSSAGAPVANVSFARAPPFAAVAASFGVTRAIAAWASDSATRSCPICCSAAAAFAPSSADARIASARIAIEQGSGPFVTAATVA